MDLYEEKQVRSIVRKCLEESFIMGEEVIDEMAYPDSFNFDEFKSIGSFAGRIKYAREKLLGKAGQGSSRAVFRVDSEKVIKIALNSKGIAQNEAESEGYKQQYDVLARVFDIDEQNYTWLEMELAKKVTPNRFKQLTGFKADDLRTWIPEQRGERVYNTVNHELDDNEFANDLLHFIQDFDYPSFNDFGRESSFGEVSRDGVPKIVVVDFGYDKNTEDIYKASREKSRKKASMYAHW